MRVNFKVAYTVTISGTNEKQGRVSVVAIEDPPEDKRDLQTALHFRLSYDNPDAKSIIIDNIWRLG